MWKQIVKAIGNSVSNIGSAAQGKETKEYENPFKNTGSKGSTESGTETTEKPNENQGISDERLKEIFGDDDRVACLSKIHSYDFTYKPEAQKEYGVDSDEHTGVVAQEIESNPAFKGCVGELDDGTKVLNIKELAAANTAAISDLAREIENLKKVLGER